jgi:hypothetical protein
MKSLKITGSDPPPPENSIPFPMNRACPSSAWVTSSPSPLAAFQEDGPQWKTQRRFHCNHNHIHTQMLENVCLAFIIYFLTGLLFSCGILFQYFVYEVLIVIIFLA